ncbi:hypothetical protein [Sphingobacterium sp. IITKGP-BTPF85]|uniref:hypothetical protein n=1 Tax=Sphingobacterium sp. IITKGP-BTPF85 TaxID=1338009 RepID=UPI0003F8D7EA|nr:hypothetical protein [Sphingobacterium sp. IITKGP-BTPF85]
MNNLLKKSVLAVALLATVNSIQAQWTGPKIKSTEIKEIKYGPLSPANRTDEAMVAFRNYGLGQFIHWGLYAIPGNEWEGVSAVVVQQHPNGSVHGEDHQLQKIG